MIMLLSECRVFVNDDVMKLFTECLVFVYEVRMM